MDRLEAEFGARVTFLRYNIDDPSSEAAKRRYRFRAQPQVVIVSAQGEVVLARLSELTYPNLSRELAAVLGETRIIRATKTE